MCSDFGVQINKVWYCFHCFPIYFPWSDGTRCHILVFWMLSFKPTFSLSSFTFVKRLFNSSSFSAIRVVSSAYLRLLILTLLKSEFILQWKKNVTMEDGRKILQWKKRVKKLAWNSTFRRLRSWHLVPSLHGKWMGRKWSHPFSLANFLFLGTKITADSDCSHEIKRYLPLRRKGYDKPG